MGMEEWGSGKGGKGGKLGREERRGVKIKGEATEASFLDAQHLKAVRATVVRDRVLFPRDHVAGD